MLVLDINKLSKEQNTTAEAIRKQLMARLKRGELYSRFHPQLLLENELFPCYLAAGHRRAAATLAPFAVANKPGAWEWETEPLSAKRISYCYPPHRQAGTAVQKRALEQLELYYDLANPFRYRQYTWFDLNFHSCPYYPLIRDLLTVLEHFRIDNPPALQTVEAWETPEPDDYEMRLQLTAAATKNDQLLFSVRLTRRHWEQTQTYMIKSDRYGFVRQQLITALGGRLNPARPDAAPAGQYRGRVYRRPGLKRI